MKFWLIYERIIPNWGDPYDECIGEVKARTENSALNKARKMFRWEHHGGEYGAYSRRRNTSRFFAKYNGEVPKYKETE